MGHIKMFLFQKTSKVLLFLTLLSFCNVWSQDEKQDNPIIAKFTEYANTPREIAYAHLNKTVYIKGETVAFKVYVFDKYDKGLSKLTKNLYWTISNAEGRVIKEAMILVENGTAEGNFFADEDFTSGNYIFTAYTNWMMNFNEPNYYSQNIKIIDPNKNATISTKAMSAQLDAQILPEGGHLVAKVKNTMGVIIKDSLGFGVPNVAYHLVNGKNEILSSNTTNTHGMSKFDMIPNGKDSYRLKVDFQGEPQYFDISPAASYGIAMSLKDLNNKIAIKFVTNDQTLPQLKNKNYTLTIHNGAQITATNVRFENEPEILALIKYEDLSPGISVFTLFDENKKPIVERLFFNYEGIKNIETGIVRTQQKGDSLQIAIPLKNLVHNTTNSFSVSVLPTATKSYNQNENILSKVYLQPYVKGPIENAPYYFTNVDNKRKYELDNLLLTQGWSSYDWTSIFSGPPAVNHNFETGISFKANASKARSSRFMMYPTSKNEAETFVASADDQSFEKYAFFPLENEKVRLGVVRNNQKVDKSSLYLQFFPSKIPKLELAGTSMPVREHTYYESSTRFPIIETSWSDIEALDEVFLSVKKSEVRVEKLKSSPFENVYIFNDRDRFAYTDFASYISTKGFKVYQNLGELIIMNRSVMKSGFLEDEIEEGESQGSKAAVIDHLPSKPTDQGVPAIYLNDILVTDHSYLYSFDMAQVDYITINKRGFGQGLKGGAGIIKIYTDPALGYRSDATAEKYQEIDIPLTFSTPKKFYVPRYQSYSNDFFKGYGVVDWISNPKIDANGNLTFKISDSQQTDVNFYVEGTSGDGKFLSTVKTLKL